MLNSTLPGCELHVANLDRLQVITGISDKLFSMNDLILEDFLIPNALTGKSDICR